MKRKFLTGAMCFFLLLSGCGSQTNKTTEQIETEQVTTTIATQEQTLEKYSDDYISFEYDKELFTINPSDDGSILSIECPSMPEEPAGTHNTIMGVITHPNDSLSDFSQEEVQELCEILAKQTCQDLFELKEGESIVEESTKYSNFCDEYYMEINDGSKCYLKTLNYNSCITMIFVRVCDYSKDYNNAFMTIYNSAESVLGNYDFNSELDGIVDSQELINKVNSVLTQCSAADHISIKDITKVDDSASHDIFHSPFIYYNSFDGREIEVSLHKVDDENYPIPWEVLWIKDSNSDHYYFAYGSSNFSSVVDIYDYNTDILIKKADTSPEENLEKIKEKQKENMSKAESIYDNASQLAQ